MNDHALGVLNGQIENAKRELRGAQEEQRELQAKLVKQFASLDYAAAKEFDRLEGGHQGQDSQGRGRGAEAGKATG